MKNEIQIIDIKSNPNSFESNTVRSYLRNAKPPHRLNVNYQKFDPWIDSTIEVCNLLMIDGAPVSIGCIQKKDHFPEGFCRINTRHFIFPEFRSQSLNIETIGRTSDGVLFGGAIIRHQIELCKDLGYKGVFVSRDRGLRSFRYFMESKVNALLSRDLPRLKIIESAMFNVCNNTKLEICWHWIAATSYDQSFTDSMLAPLPRRGIEQSHSTHL